MKKLFLLCIASAMSTGVFAQEITLKKSGRLEVKTESSVETPKVKVTEVDKKAKKEKFNRKKREGLGYAKGNEGKAKAKINKADAKIKDEGKGITKRVKELPTMKKTEKEDYSFKRRKGETSDFVKGKDGEAKSEINKVDAKIKDEGKGIIKRVKETASNEKAPKIADKVTGNFNGKNVYTGIKGGRYYINSNGNKTYIQD
jgi:colicin import membrane protein